MCFCILKKFVKLNMVNLPFLFLGSLITTVCFAQESISDSSWNFTPYTSFYSQSLYLSQLNDFITQNKLKLDLIQWNHRAILYTGVAFDQDSRSNEVEILNFNSVSPLVGLAVTPLVGFPLTLFGEYRDSYQVVQKAVNNNVSYQSWLLGVYSYDIFNLRRITASSQLFAEYYTESVYSSLLDHNTYGQVWGKIGPRFYLSHVVSADIYGETLVKRDRLRYLKTNSEEVGPGFRLNLNFGKIYSSASVRRGFGIYSTTGESFAEWSGVLSLGGQL
jgi:hypothetical protein